MSRSKKGNKGAGFDYWGRRALSGTCGYGPQVKKHTTRTERSRHKKELRERPDDMPGKEAI